MTSKLISNLKNLFLLAAIILMAGMLAPGQHAQAEGNGTYNKLYLNKTYTNYDVTGDGVTDTVKLTATGLTSDAYAPPSKLTITVNGKKAYSLKTEYGVYDFDVKLVTLANQKAYIVLETSADAGAYHASYIMQYKKSSGKFKILYDLQKLFTKYNPYVFVYFRTGAVNGNEFTLELFFMNYTLGGLNCNITFKYQSGKLVRKANMDITEIKRMSGTSTWGKTLTANKKMTVYKTAALKSKSFTIKKGTIVDISSFSYKNGKLAIKVQANGKTGWIASAKSYSTTQPFKEVLYAG